MRFVCRVCGLAGVPAFEDAHACAGCWAEWEARLDDTLATEALGPSSFAYRGPGAGSDAGALPAFSPLPYAGPAHSFEAGSGRAALSSAAGPVGGGERFRAGAIAGSAPCSTAARLAVCIPSAAHF